MKNTIRMTADEIRKNFDVDAAIAMARAAPVSPDPYPAGKIGGRGFASFKNHINMLGRPKNVNRKIMIGVRLPETIVMGMRNTNGYSRIVAEYIMAGITNGDLHIPSIRNHA
jgi:hypothetical protein